MRKSTKKYVSLFWDRPFHSNTVSSIKIYHIDILYQLSVNIYKVYLISNDKNLKNPCELKTSQIFKHTNVEKYVIKMCNKTAI